MLDARFACKLRAVALVQEWVRDVGGPAGLHAGNCRVITGVIGAPESSIEIEVSMHGLADLEQFFARVDASAHRDWGAKAKVRKDGKSARARSAHVPTRAHGEGCRGGARRGVRRGRSHRGTRLVAPRLLQDSIVDGTSSWHIYNTVPLAFAAPAKATVGMNAARPTTTQGVTAGVPVMDAAGNATPSGLLLVRARARDRPRVLACKCAAPPR